MTNEFGLKKAKYSDAFVRLFSAPLMRRYFMKALSRIATLEGGIFFSRTLRDVLSSRRNVTLGSYSYGPIDDLFNFPIKTKIGRYVSIGPGVRIFQANHPSNFLSTHPFFYRSDIGITSEEAIIRYQLKIGHDVWIGANTIICPGCHCIGTGAIIGAGAVVTKDVLDYAIVGGNPARIIKMRFSESTITSLLASKWWELPYDSLKPLREELTCPFNEDLTDKIIALRAGLQ